MIDAKRIFVLATAIGDNRFALRKQLEKVTEDEITGDLEPLIREARLLAYGNTNPHQATSRLMGIGEAAAILGLSEYTVRERARLGGIPGAFLDGRKWRFRQHQFSEYLDSLGGAA